MLFKQFYSLIFEYTEEELDHWRKNLEPGTLIEYRPGTRHGGSAENTTKPIIPAKFKGYKKSLPGYGYPGAPNYGSGWRLPGERGYEREDARWYIVFEYLHSGSDSDKSEWVSHSSIIEHFYPLSYDTKKQLSTQTKNTFGDLIDEL